MAFITARTIALCKLMLVLTIILPSNNVAARNLLDVPRFTHVKRDEMNNTNVGVPNPPQSPGDGPWDIPWDGNV
ncbi:hypothetical protein SDJN03_05415, partial [Cucurbita argyrosperma subsp. sororia]